MDPTADTAPITNTGNRRIVEARKLRQRKYREREGRFLIEGLQLLHMALDAGARPVEVFYCEEYFTGNEAPALVERFRKAGVTPVRVARRVMETLSERDEPQGIVAALALFERQLIDLRLTGRELVVVGDRLQDPGNLGTIIRTADAVGAAALVLIEPSTDPFDPKTVRSSMGSLFNLPIVRTPDVAGLFEWCRQSGLRPVGADAHLGTLWGEGMWGGGVALVLGNEAHGLSADVTPHIHHWAHLPVIGKADSLNVSVAAGVLMYEWLHANYDVAPSDAQSGAHRA
jgi:RNA methyltransferase, TrmH family